MQGSRPQPEDAEAAAPDQALARPGLLDGNPAGSQSWLSAKHFPTAEQAPKLNPRQLHRAVFGIKVL